MLPCRELPVRTITRDLAIRQGRKVSLRNVFNIAPYVYVYTPLWTNIQIDTACQHILKYSQKFTSSGQSWARQTF